MTLAESGIEPRDLRVVASRHSGGDNAAQLLQSLIRRRAAPKPDDVLRHVFGRSNCRLAVYLNWSDDFLMFVLYPAIEKAKFEKRSRDFGTPYPGLFSVDGRSFGRSTINQHRPGGAVKIVKWRQLMFGDNNKQSVIVTPVFLEIAPSSSITICNLTIDTKASFNQRYHVYFTIIIAFGQSKHSYSGLDYLEDLIVDFFDTSLPKEKMTPIGENRFGSAN